MKKRKVNRKFTQCLLVNKNRKKDYLDTLYMLENNWADNILTEQQFNEGVEHFKDIYNIV